MNELFYLACGALFMSLVRLVLKPPAPRRKAEADPDCIHCRGLGYDASGYGCPCVKEVK